MSMSAYNLISFERHIGGHQSGYTSLAVLGSKNWEEANMYINPQPPSRSPEWGHIKVVT